MPLTCPMLRVYSSSSSSSLSQLAFYLILLYFLPPFVLSYFPPSPYLPLSYLILIFLVIFLSQLGRFFTGLEFVLFSETNVNGFGNPADIPSSFPALSILGLNRTQLSSWEELEKLRHFPKLTDVRLSGIPFLEV